VNFKCLLAARTLSVLGNGFGRVALAFSVLDATGATPVDLSVVLACQALPQLAFVLVGGVIADRARRHRLMVMAELTAAAAWAALTYLGSLHVVELAPMAVAAVVAGTATALFAPAMTGLVPELVEPGQLQRANALIRVGQNVALLVGLSGAGLVVSAVGPTMALLLNALSFLVSAALISRVRIPDRPRGRSALAADLRTGLGEFFARQWLWVVVTQFAFVVAAMNATSGVLGPLAAAEDLGGPRAWAVLATAQAVGAIAGAGLATRLRPRRPILVAVLVSTVAGLPMLLLAGRAPLLVIAGLMCLSGVATDIFSVLWSTTMQRRVPADVISRVSSVDLFGSLALAPLGLLAAGPLAARFGTGYALYGCAAMIFASAACALLSPEVRRLRQADDPRSAISGLPGVRGDGSGGRQAAGDEGSQRPGLEDRLRRLAQQRSHSRGYDEQPGGRLMLGQRIARVPARAGQVAGGDLGDPVIHLPGTPPDLRVRGELLDDDPAGRRRPAEDRRQPVPERGDGLPQADPRGEAAKRVIERGYLAVADHREQQVHLRLEVVEDEAVRHRCRLRDARGRGAVEASLHEQLARGMEDPVPSGRVSGCPLTRPRGPVLACGQVRDLH
jgi:predicted MFS family arabinose efflux permease